MTDNRLDRYFLEVAGLTAGLSKAVRKKVGAVLVKDKRIVSVGYNGTPCGFDNCCEDKLEDGSLVTKSIVVHAEANAMFFCAKNAISTDNSTMYLTLSPCPTCALGMIQAGVKRVVYSEEYRDLSGVDILKNAGVTVEKFVESRI